MKLPPRRRAHRTARPLQIRSHLAVLLALAVLAGSCREPLAPTPGEPALLQAVSSRELVGQAGVALPDLAVRVTDARGTAVPQVMPEWNAESGTVQPLAASGADGIATARWTAGPSVGAQSATASLPGLTPVVFHASVGAGAPATAVAFSGDGQELTAVGAVPSQLSVRVEDVFGNAVPGARVQWSVLAGGGVVTGFMTSTDAAGEARSGWTLGATIEEQRVRARVAASLDVVFSARVLPASLEVTPASVRIGAGTTAHLRSVFRDAASTALGGRVDWQAEDESVATVDSLGSATALAIGATRVVATSGALVAYADLDVTTPTTTVSGRIFALGGPPTPGLRFHVYSDGGTFSAPIDATGFFALGADLSGNFVDLLVDVAAGERVYHPSLMRMSRVDVPSDYSVLMVPRSYVISAGSLSGTTVPISLRDAFQPPCATQNDPNCDGYYPSYWHFGMALYRDDRLPVPLAFDRERSTNPISASDSVAFWSHIQAMHNEIGRQLFRPAGVEEVGVLGNGEPAAGVLIRIDNTISGFAAWANWWWDANRDLTRGLVRFGNTSYLGSANLVRHELLHTQGFKHTCSWNTVMGGYGCGSSASLSSRDIAYAQLAWQLRSHARQVGAADGLIAALNGELSLLGLPLLSLPVDLMPLAEPGGDEAGEMGHACGG